MNESSSPGRSGTQHRTRKPHKKSRHGCTRCRKRRIKCDELTPRCSRCNKMDLTCQYRNGKPAPSTLEHHHPIAPADRGTLLPQPERPRTDSVLDSPEISSHASAIAGKPSSSASIVFPCQSLPVLHKRGRRLSSPLQSQVQTLEPREFELFQHYLEHTSRDLTVDDGDQYTLQIGIPNLACQSKPLMSSVLAIAAVCKCCDLISQSPVSQEDRGQVLELLSLADRYHMESLREIQATLPEAEQYDNVLANAAMMGMYGSGSHRTRIWLAKTATSGDSPLSRSMPKHSQWISLFRAVSLAYVGLLNNKPRTDDITQLNPASSPVSPTHSGGLQTQYQYKVSSRPKQPRTPLPDHALCHILAATVGSALARVRENAREIAIVQASNEGCHHHDAEIPTAHSNPELQACFTALDLFSSIVTETFYGDDSSPNTPELGHLAFEVDVDPVGRLSKVSPWLRRYTASITSMIPSRLPRRTIMSFVHKVPTSYLNLVEEMLSLIQPEALDGDEAAWNSPASMTPDPTLAHQLAVDIFAHWLVLVILLDNVWWIGGIGAWELGRIVASFRKGVRWQKCLWNKDEDWWPESMFEISRQFDKHR